MEDAKGCSLFTFKELKEAVLSKEKEETLNLGGMPAEVYKLVSFHRSDLLFGAFNGSL